MSLASVQRAFKAYLLDQPGEIMTHVSGGRSEGLAVYHNAYRGQLVVALRDSFERLLAWLGDDAFDAAARTHIVNTPPSSWTLGDYGVDFPVTLARLYPDDPEIADLAALDWALRRAFDATNASPIAPKHLASVDWSHARFKLTPSLSIIQVTTNAAALWSAMADGIAPPPVKLLPLPASIRVWRQGLTPRFSTIDSIEAAAIRVVLADTSFALLCDDLANMRGVGDAVERASMLLASWLGDGLIIGIGDPARNFF